MKIRTPILAAVCILLNLPFFAATEQSDDKDAIIISKIEDSASIEDRLFGFSMAHGRQSAQINEKLVSLLDSTVLGGKSGCNLLLPSWHEALIILTERFPECSISKSPILYTKEDCELFKKWWRTQSQNNKEQQSRTIKGAAKS